MKTRSEVSEDKLRGGFYTPPPLVDFCLERLLPLVKDRARLRIVEPSAGDGAFIRGLQRSVERGEREVEILAIEALEIEAEKCRRTLAASRFKGTVVADSAVVWAARSPEEQFDAAFGNPPFIRYQFVADRDRDVMPQLAAQLGIRFAGVSNLWIPVLLGTLSKLRAGGAFSFVVPTECFTGHAARTVRSWLVERCEEGRVDLFPPGSFPGVLQEVAVLSGRNSTASASAPAAQVRIVEHEASGRSTSQTHSLSGDEHSWMHLLLEPEQRAALEAARQYRAVQPLGAVARFEVSIVTGANDFFSVNEEELVSYELAPWARPLLPRIRHAPGLRYTTEDQEEMRRSGAPAWLLDFSDERPDPVRAVRAAEYVRLGEARGLPTRYKCRIREPWYRVPHIERGSLLLSKRSHHLPRVVVNKARVFTTDTIYRGEVRQASISPADLAATFHNSLTLLTAELEGRSFGGGVLELVPSEIARLLVPVIPGAGANLLALDQVARSSAADLIRASDDLVAKRGAVPADLMRLLRAAWSSLVKRRLERNETNRSELSAEDQLTLAA